ncbi:MAG: LysR substrate-binding domain-containing protein, partial [Gammaproteobacteria bacterium]|nr:LysR substrate-binding domain-containing protein [Gammaproteobacteria bacterium]
MDLVKALKIFTEVARHEGFAPAARRLNMSTSAVSRYVLELEDYLGVQLFKRSTRSVKLTESGDAYLSHGRRILEEVETLKARAAENQHPGGVLRIAAPEYLGRHFVAAMLPGYLAAYPDVEIELVLQDRMADLIDEGFDLAIRTTALKDSALIARKLRDVHLKLVASSDYVAAHGAPKDIDELKQRHCIIDTTPEFGARWPLLDKGKPKQVRVQGNVRVNSGAVAREMALAGLGLTLLPDFFVAADIAAGRLVSFLDKQIN